jgi:hypothetical protein
MVTPIQDMLNIWELDDRKTDKVAYLDEPLQIDGRIIKQVQFVDDKAEEISKNSNSFLAYPAKTPLLVSGLDEDVLNYLNTELKDYDVKPVQAGGMVRNKEEIDDRLVPGSAVAVQLVKGDIEMSAIGTLTYREDNRILGFGHRFMGKGDSNYFLSSAYIHQMIKNLEMPFKLGTPLNLKGIITQDRSAGVGGRIGIFPRVVPLRIKVKDQDLNRTREINTQLVRNEDLIQSLAGSVVYQAINSTMDRQGGGTAEVKMEIMANSLENNIIKRENIFYSRRDVASVALNDFLEGLTLITQNPFQELNLIDINLDIKVKEEPQVALIEEVKFSQKKVKPGDKLELKVKLRPYRQEAIINKYEFKLPEDIETGIASLELIGGREANFTLQQEVEREETEYGHGENETFKDLEEVLKAFKEQKINSDLVLRILPNYQMEAVPVSKTGEDNSDMNSPHENAQMPVDDAQMISNEYEESFATDYILEGRVDTEIEIISNETPNEESGKQQKEVDKPQKFDKKSKNQ